MKVGIITRHAYPNYGSLFQAYALQEAVNRLGYQAVCIDYVNKSEDSWRLCFSQLKESRMNSNILKKIAYCIIQLPNYTFNTYAFRKMQLECLKLTQKYSSKDDIKEQDIEIYCTGSDQVWNQIHNCLDPAYFLDFTHKTAKRIAYGASFGKDSIAIEDTATVKKLIERYAFVSVREESGVAILNKLGIKSQWVVDPVMLFDIKFWEERADEIKDGYQYVLIYQLHYNQELTLIAHKLAKIKKLKIVRLTCELKQRFLKNEKVIYLPSLKEFLGYIKGASYIVTDSFHGTVFSLEFRKQFLEVAPGVNKTRNESLLKMTHLENRFADINNVIEIAEREIDYQEVERLIDIQRKRSWRYLKEALNTNTGICGYK